MISGHCHQMFYLLVIIYLYLFVISHKVMQGYPNCTVNVCPYYIHFGGGGESL